MNIYIKLNSRFLNIIKKRNYSEFVQQEVAFKIYLIFIFHFYQLFFDLNSFIIALTIKVMHICILDSKLFIFQLSRRIGRIYKKQVSLRIQHF